ncbi:MAG: cation transporter [Kiritimatiellaceae bacterium]|nr:cation transporter [Kiritimatiellaceae bacterium]
MEVSRKGLVRFAWLSTAAAVLTIGLKTVAYFLTGSVGLLSDALESVVNLAGGLMAVAMLTVAARPADEDHPYGHSKAEYFSSVVEGALILVAAASIGIAAVHRLVFPRPLEQIGLGLAVSVAASLVNLVVAIILLWASRRHDSITLEANAHHLLTDVWTSAGVLIGIGAVVLTGWTQLDPIVALIVAGNIVWTGVRIMRTSVGGLMDAAISTEEQQKVRDILGAHLEEGAQYHALRTRQAGAQRFISFHMLVPGTWTVARGHQLIDHIEADLRDALSHVTVFSHLESLEDPASWDDAETDR